LTKLAKSPLYWTIPKLYNTHMSSEGQNLADRISAMALIRAFLKKHYLLSSRVIASPIGHSILQKVNNGVLTRDDLKAITEIMGETPSKFLQRHFGNSTRHWSNILYNEEIPTRLDLQCLNVSLETDDLFRIRYKSKMIHNMQKMANHGSKKIIPGAKKPLRRRDGSIYNADSRNLLNIVGG